MYQVEMDEFEQAEAVVIDVIDGKRSFDEGLQAVVTYQEKWNESLCRYWRSQSFSSASSFSVDEIPAVPVEAFRELRLVSSEREVKRVFRTSGTTSGVRGEHLRFRTDAYDLGARKQFDQCVLGGRRGFVGVHWVPGPEAADDSSLSHMVSDLSRMACEGETTFLLGQNGLVDVPPESREQAREGRPVLCFGTAFAFAEWIEAGGAWTLPHGSVVIETGGFKAKRVGMTKSEYLTKLREAFGKNAEYWSEYSMTELSSQGYGRLAYGDEPQSFQFPPWCLVSAVDPDTLRPMREGERGVLRFVDLANVESCVAVQTEDVGSVDGNRVTLSGRLPGSSARGCSLAAEEILSASRDVSRETRR